MIYMVMEWCQDGYASNYPTPAVTDPTGPPTGSSWVFRDDSWHPAARNCRSDRRRRYTSGLKDSFIGFRLVLLSGQ